MIEVRHAKPVLWDTLMGQGWEGGGKGVQDGGDTSIPVANSCQCMAKIITNCKVIILQLKLINLKNPNGKENEKEYICKTESPCHASEINTTS